MSRRIRSIKPEWLDDEKIAGASDEARVLSVALILMSDDYGRGRAALAAIAAGAWQYQLEREDGAHAPEILARASRALRELVEMGFVTVYQVDGQRYFEIRNWSKHQKVDKPGKPQIPAPRKPESLDIPEIRESLARVSREPPESLATDQDQDQEGIKDQDQERESAGEPATPRPVSVEPTPGVALHRAYVAELERRTARHDSLTSDKRKAADVAASELARTAELRGVAVDALVRVSLERWFADPWGRQKGFPFVAWAKQAASLATGEKAPPKGMAPPVSHQEFGRLVAEAGGSGHATIVFE
jgi:hypothetical protein